MVYRRRAIAFTVAIALGCSAGLFAQKIDKKRDEAQKKDGDAIAKLVDQVANGTAQPPNDFGLTWARDDAFKAVGNREFVPFTVTLDPAKVAAGNVNFYWRVVAKTAPAAAPAAPGKNDKKDKDKKAGPEYPWEDINLNVPVTSGASGAHIARSFTVTAGEYDVYVVCQEPTVPQPKGAPPVAQKVAVLKHALTVPDFWNGEFSTSSVIVSRQVTQLPAQLTAQQAIDRPYAFGPIELQPTLDYKLVKKDELQVFFVIYNPKTDAANKPVVTVEYNFYAKSGGTEKFFNKTPVLNLNAGTLPPQFDLAQGHQLQGGEDVPLASFPEGDYRLEIKVTDTLASKTVTRDVNFTVSAS